MSSYRDVTFVGFGRAGGAHYRTHLPARVLGANIYTRHWDTSDEENPELVTSVADGTPNGDIVVYHMPIHSYHLDECREIVAQHRRLIVDLDDDLVGVTEYEQHAWAEGIKELVPDHTEAIRTADLVTCSTPWLAQRISERFPSKEIHVCENGLDTQRYNIRQLRRRKDKYVIGWEGGLGHEGAWDMLAPQVKQFMQEVPESVLLIVGQALPDHFPPDEFQDRIAYHPWKNSLTDYILPLSIFNIGVAPSMPIDFYRAKSPLRLLEYQAMAIPALCSPTTYEDYIDDTRTALIVQDDEWLPALRWAYENRAEMYKMGQRGRKWLRENYTIGHTAPQWEAVIERARNL